MILKVTQINPTDDGMLATVVNTGPDGQESLQPGSYLRCGGYRYHVLKVLGIPNSTQFGIVVDAKFGIQPGMILRPALEPATPDECAGILMRLNTLFQLLAEFDEQTLLAEMLGESPVRNYLHERDMLEQTRDILRNIVRLKSSLPDIKFQRLMSATFNAFNTKFKALNIEPNASARIGG